MKKNFLACTMATLMTVGAVAGMSSCSNTEDLSGKLAIWALDAGYGTEWIDEMVKAYKEIYPSVEVAVVKDNTIASKFDTTLRNPDSNEYDLIFSNTLNVNQYVGMNLKVGGKTYENLVLDLSNVLYNQKPVGKNGAEENTLIKDKVRGEFLDIVSHENGNLYAYPYAGGASGIIYNETLFEEKGWEIPETTSELLALTKKIYNEEVVGKSDSEKIYPWVWSGKCPSYWQALEFSLYGSYVGLDNYRAFWQCRQYEGDAQYPGTKSNGDLSAPTPEVYKSAGRLEMLKVMEEILYPNASDDSISSNDSRYVNGYCVPNSQDSTVDKAQRDFLNGKAAMYVCGSWLEREMEDWYKNNPNNTVKLKVMKTPVLDLAKSYWDKALADGAVTETEYNNAMNFQYSSGGDLVSVIPSYSKEQEQAVNFLRFMSSEDGALIYAKYAKSILPLNYNWNDSAWTTKFNDFVQPGSFLQSQVDIDKVCAYGYDGARINKIFYKNGVIEFYCNGQFPEPIFTRLNQGERRTAIQLYNSYISAVEGAWSGIVK